MRNEYTVRQKRPCWLRKLITSCSSSDERDPHYPLRWTTEAYPFDMWHHPHHHNMRQGRDSHKWTYNPHGSPWDGFFNRWGSPNTLVDTPLGSPCSDGMAFTNQFGASPHHFTPSSAQLPEPTQQCWNFSNGTLNFVKHPTASVASPGIGWGSWESPKEKARLHPHLTLNPFNTHLPSIHWDLHQMPPTAQHYSARHLFTPENLDLVATSPGAKSIIIDISDCSRHPLLDDWGTTIDLEKIIPDARRSITIGDILYAIYDYFQQPMTHVEVLAACGRSDQNMDVMEKSLKTRCLKVAGIPEVEWKRGFRRVDILGDYRYFYGMTVQDSGDSSFTGTWRLKLVLGPPFKAT